jgi:hypothetical protein
MGIFMKMKLLFVGIVVFLCSFSSAQELKKNESIEIYRKRISTLNLINGLYLTNPQIEKYLAILKELKNTQNEYQSNLDSYSSEIEKQYEKLLSEVSDGKGITKETEKSASEIHKKEKELKEEYMAKICSLEERIIPILTENQLCIIDDFKPCLIPPKNLKDPSRVGQARGDASATVNHLERLRKIPEKKFENAKRRFIDEYIGKYEEKISILNPEEKDQEIKRVNSLINYAIALSDVDFEMKKEDIAKDLTLDKITKTSKRKNELGRIGRFLLDADLISVLEKRLIAGK